MDKKVITNPAAKPAASPYSPCLIAGPMVFVSGQVAVDPATGQLAGADIMAQTRQVLKNVQALLEAAGVGLKDVVKTTVFLAKMEHFQAMNAVYLEFFSAPLPTRSTIGAALARPAYLVEIDAIAMRP